MGQPFFPRCPINEGPGAGLSNKGSLKKTGKERELGQEKEPASGHLGKRVSLMLSRAPWLSGALSHR